MIPKHEPIKKVYVEMVKEVIESEVDIDDAECMERPFYHFITFFCYNMRQT